MNVYVKQNDLLLHNLTQYYSDNDFCAGDAKFYPWPFLQCQNKPIPAWPRPDDGNPSHAILPFGYGNHLSGAKPGENGGRHPRTKP